MATVTMVCTKCGFVGQPQDITKGTLVMEICLWLLFLVPGFIYSIWRLASRHKGCPKCKSADMIPVDSPMGKKLTAT